MQRPHDTTGGGAGEGAGDRERTPARAMHLLASGVPLSLLVDLATPDGPDSAQICAAEGGPEDPWWGPAA